MTRVGAAHHKLAHHAPGLACRNVMGQAALPSSGSSQPPPPSSSRRPRAYAQTFTFSVRIRPVQRSAHITPPAQPRMKAHGSLTVGRVAPRRIGRRHGHCTGGSHRPHHAFQRHVDRTAAGHALQRRRAGPHHMHGCQAVVASQLDALASPAPAPLHRERAHRHALADPLPHRHRSLQSVAEVCCLRLVAVTRACSCWRPPPC